MGISHRDDVDLIQTSSHFTVQAPEFALSHPWHQFTERRFGLPGDALPPSTQLSAGFQYISMFGAAGTGMEWTVRVKLISSRMRRAPAHAMIDAS
jgi:hypothetical protein